MKQRNIQSLENLSLFSHFCGMLTIFIGILVIFLELFSRGIAYIQTGLFILASGYTFAKISEKVSNILLSERE